MSDFYSTCLEGRRRYKTMYKMYIALSLLSTIIETSISKSKMFTKTTKTQAIEQFKYNWKVYTLRCKREGKRVTKLAKVFAWQDFTEFLKNNVKPLIRGFYSNNSIRSLDSLDINYTDSRTIKFEYAYPIFNIF